jgi:7-cyano-7-deazaguanine synthase
LQGGIQLAVNAVQPDATVSGRRVVALVSGGIDSVTLAHYLHAQDADLALISFDYGQRHRCELIHAQLVAQRLSIRHDVVDLTAATSLLSGSALTDPSVDVPHGHYTDQSMRATVVPNRNAIFLVVATGIAVARQANAVAFAAHAGDHPIYPDCRPAFVDAFTQMTRIANEGFVAPDFTILAPFGHLTKADIVAIGDQLSVPYAATWSCYEGGETHCGRCGTCVERKEAFTVAGVSDPTTYLA